MRQGLTNDEIREMITAQVTMAVREATLEVFESTKTTMIEMFDKRYATASTTTTVVADAGVQGSGYF